MPPLTSEERSGAAEPSTRTSLSRSLTASAEPHAKVRTRRSAFRHARIARILVLALVMLFLGTGITSVVAYSTARQVESQVVAEFTAGQAQLESGKTFLQKATKDRNAAELDQAKADFVAAKVHFQRAPDLISQSVFLSVATSAGVPYVAPRLKAAKQLAVMGTSLADAALIGVEIDGLMMRPNSGSGGAFAVLKQATSKVPEIRSDLTTALNAALAVDPALLPSSQAASLTSGIASIRNALKSVDELGTVLPVATEILGGNGPRTYLVEQVTNAELRAGGGFIGSFSVISANQGEMKITMGGDIGEYVYPRAVVGQPAYVAPPGPLQNFIGRESFELADSNYFPDFKTNAQWALRFAQPNLHVKPDGVISIDPDAVAALLAVTGPLKVPGYNVTVDSATFTDWLFQQQYSLKNAANKKAIFGAIASELIPMVTSLPPSRWPDLMTQLNKMASQRHLQIYFTNVQAESAMDQYGWSGAMNPHAASDFMYEVESNFTASKVNHFLSRAYSVDLSVVNGELHHAVTVQLRNSEPAGYEGGNIYDCYVRLYVPAAATNLSHSYLAPQTGVQDNSAPQGYQEFNGWMEILGSKTRTLHFEWDTPFDAASTSNSIYWQKQPGTGSDPISITWHAGGHAYSASGALETDKQIVLTPTSVTLSTGQAGSASVPSLSL